MLLKVTKKGILMNTINFKPFYSFSNISLDNFCKD
jgi:hypothetical protein